MRNQVLFVSLLFTCSDSDEEQPPCTFDGAYYVAYSLVAGDASCPRNLAPSVFLRETDEEQCTTGCEFGDSNLCETTFSCDPGNPVVECRGAERFVAAPLGSPCEYELTLQRFPDELRIATDQRSSY